MSPILVRPVREQLEHDRVIRLLQVRLKRRGEIVANIGESQTVPVKIGQMQIYPDLVLTSGDRSNKLTGTVEVETSESVNHLEARAQWAHLGRARAPFHLYVPVGSVEIARRLASENGVNVSEIWSFHTIGDQTRFTLVHRAPREARRPTREARPAGPMPPKPVSAPKPAVPVKKRADSVKKRTPPASRRNSPPRLRGNARTGKPAARGQNQKRK